MGIIEVAVAIGTSIGAAASAGAGAIAGAVGAAGSAIAGATLGEIGMAMGLAGAGLGIIGQATGIKELSYAGMALGAVGGITAIGSSIAGIGEMTVEQAISHVDDFLTGATGTAAKATQSATGVLSGATTAADGTTTVPGSMSQLEGSLVPEAGKMASPAMSQESNLTAPAKFVSGPVTEVNPASAVQGAPTVQAPLTPQPAMAPGSGVLSSTDNLPIQNDIAEAIAGAGKTQPIGSGTVLQPGMTGYQDPGIMSKIADATKKGWDNLSPDSKMMLTLVAAQGGSGMLSGMFQGMSASQRLEFDKLMNQQQYGQMQYLNKNNSYSPLVKFSRPTGVLSQQGT